MDWRPPPSSRYGSAGGKVIVLLGGFAESDEGAG